MTLLTFLATTLQESAAPPTTDAGAGQQVSPLVSILGGPFMPLLMIGALVYFMIWRPEKKARAKRAEMIAGLKKGDRILTASGIYGSVVQVQDAVVTVQVAEGFRLKMAVSAVQSVEPEEDSKAVESK